VLGANDNLVSTASQIGGGAAQVLLVETYRSVPVTNVLDG